VFSLHKEQSLSVLNISIAQNGWFTGEFLYNLTTRKNIAPQHFFSIENKPQSFCGLFS